MANLFESYERRIDHINEVLAQYGINGIEDAKAICDAKGIDPYKMCEETQPICFENAKWAYVVGAAIAIKYTTAEEFGTAYQTMLDSISAKYSGAKVFCFTLIPNNQRTDQTEWNAYNEQIRTVVENNSFAILVDIAQNSGIDWSNYTNYTVDGVHPNLAGMKKIADVFEAALSAAYVQ